MHTFNNFRLWPVIDDALRSAAVDRKVTIKLLVSHWNHTRPSLKYFVNSLTTLTRSFPWVTIEAVRNYLIKNGAKF